MSEANKNNPFALMTPELAEKIKDFKEEWYKRYKEISHEPTPQVDGNGKKIINKRWDGKDYIEDSWMSAMLNKHFPGWSWERAGGLHFLGSEVVCADGELVIIDESLIPFGINPPVRRYWAGDAVRIQYKKDAPHTIENVVDVGDNVQSAITGAKKRAINRLTGIGDDIYGKRVEDEGAGSFETILENKPDMISFGQWITENHWSWGDIIKILGVKDMTEVTDFGEAYRKVKEAKGVK